MKKLLLSTILLSSTLSLSPYSLAETGPTMEEWQHRAYEEVGVIGSESSRVRQEIELERIANQAAREYGVTPGATPEETLNKIKLELYRRNAPPKFDQTLVKIGAVQQLMQYFPSQLAPESIDPKMKAAIEFMWDNVPDNSVLSKFGWANLPAKVIIMDGRQRVVRQERVLTQAVAALSGATDVWWAAGINDMFSNEFSAAKINVAFREVAINLGIKEPYEIAGKKNTTLEDYARVLAKISKKPFTRMTESERYFLVSLLVAFQTQDSLANGDLQFNAFLNLLRAANRANEVTQKIRAGGR
jgi:hypothetical protein